MTEGALGLYGPGMHQVVLDEVEVGRRVAQAWDEEQAMGWEWVWFFSYHKDHDEPNPY